MKWCTWNPSKIIVTQNSVKVALHVIWMIYPQFLYVCQYLIIPTGKISACACSVTQSCLTLCDPMDCSLPGSPVPGVLQARILEWVAFPSSRGSSLSRDRTCVSCISRQILYHWATWEVPYSITNMVLRKDTFFL